MRPIRFLAPLLALVAGLSGARAAQAKMPSVPKQAELEKMTARFKPTPLHVDLSALSPGDRQALVLLIEACRVLDDLYLEQAWSGNRELLAKLTRDPSPTGAARLRSFWINKGPWSELDEGQAFLPGVPPRKLPGGNYYPEDMMKSEFDAWVASLPPAEQAQARGFFTAIRRNGAGRLTYVPYAREWASWIDRMAALLREAARKTDNASLKTFLNARADGMQANAYYESDLAWMDLDAPIDVTFGPYETYNDELYGYKAAFEAFLTLRDDAESARLAAISSHLQAIENSFPVAAELKNPKLGTSAPIRVVNLILGAGDAAHGPQTAAFNLPNDERVIHERGSKRVMLKNVQEAKFKQVLTPIAQKVLAAADRKQISFELFFLHILTHELSHGMGLHQIKVGERVTTPRAEMGELYSALEEARADVLGLYGLQHLMENAKALGLQGVIPTGPAAERQLYTTYLASAFRTLRFGAKEAHARGMALQLNYLLDKKAVVAQRDGTFGLDLKRVKPAVASLAAELITLHGTGNRAGAQKLFDEMGTVRPAVQKALSRLQGVPVDIEPLYVTAQELVPDAGKPVPLSPPEPLEVVEPTR